jgi:hypothetical protein
MPGPDPGIHAFLSSHEVDGRGADKVYVVCTGQTTMPGHDE